MKFIEFVEWSMCDLGRRKLFARTHAKSGNQKEQRREKEKEERGKRKKRINHLEQYKNFLSSIYQDFRLPFERIF